MFANLGIWEIQAVDNFRKDGHRKMMKIRVLQSPCFLVFVEAFCYDKMNKCGATNGNNYLNMCSHSFPMISYDFNKMVAGRSLKYGSSWMSKLGLYMSRSLEITNIQAFRFL